MKFYIRVVKVKLNIRIVKINFILNRLDKFNLENFYIDDLRL